MCFGVPFFSLYCYDAHDDEENVIEVKIPTPITFDEKWFEKIKKINLDPLSVLFFIKAGAIKN